MENNDNRSLEEIQLEIAKKNLANLNKNEERKEAVINLCKAGFNGIKTLRSALNEVVSCFRSRSLMYLLTLGGITVLLLPFARFVNTYSAVLGQALAISFYVMLFYSTIQAIIKVLQVISSEE